MLRFLETRVPRLRTLLCSLGAKVGRHTSCLTTILALSLLALMPARAQQPSRPTVKP